MQRNDGRSVEQLRPVSFEIGIQRDPAGSVLVRFGNTAVICAATVSDSVPEWLRGRGRGWVTAEYSMLPGSSGSRIPRKTQGRGTEIQRLIGRALRGAVDLEALGERLVTVDCDVLQADGGTRTASITGGYVALALAVRKLRDGGSLAADPITGGVASVSCGVVGGVPMLDLDYSEDSEAEVDMNFVMDHGGRYVEIQGTGEGRGFTSEELEEMRRLAGKGIGELIALQRQVLGA